MIKLIKFYLRVNYCSQKIGNKYNVEGGVVNKILLEWSFITSGIVLGVLILLRLRSVPFIILIIMAYVYVFRILFEKRIKNMIDFKSLELFYNKTPRSIRNFYFFLGIVFLVLSIFIMIYIIKLVGVYN